MAIKIITQYVCDTCGLPINKNCPHMRTLFSFSENFHFCDQECFENWSSLKWWQENYGDDPV